MARKAQEPRRSETAAGHGAANAPAVALKSAAPHRVLLGPIRCVGFRRWMSVTELLLFVALRSWGPAPVEVLRLKTFDFYQNIRPREAAV
jgi:hypothetical protein